MRVTDEKTSELFNWLHLKIIYKSLGIGDQKVDDQKKMNLVSQFQSSITDQVSYTVCQDCMVKYYHFYE